MALPPTGSSLHADAPRASRRIFVNRNLRMDTIKAIGFDMDYTLARYRQERFEALAYALTVEKLVEMGYPKSLKKLEYDPEFLIRGLTVDKERGNILKLDRHAHASRVFHGRRRLSKRDRRTLYRTEKINFSPPRFAMVDTFFSLPEMCLYADLVHYYSTKPDARIEWWQLYDDVRTCIDRVHADNSLKSRVKEKIEYYVDRDPLLGKTLHKLRSSGKKLFLLTNSYWPFTNRVMTYLLDDDLPEYPNWQRYFERVIVGSKKPRFFTHEDAFVEIDPDGNAVTHTVKQLVRGKVYQGGNSHALERSLNTPGEQILYVGDHIYGDILRSKKATLWRTCLVVEELEREIEHTLNHMGDVQRLLQLEGERRQLDALSNQQRRELSQLEKDGLETEADQSRFEVMRQERDGAKRRLKSVVRELDMIDRLLDEAFNHQWGMVFKDTRENSRFGEQVKNYACIYTSRVSNLLGYSAHQYFRSPRDFLPHELLDWES